MLRLQNISLLQFKNYTAKRFDFSGKVTGICGSNGIGKTNLLDAIYYLCFTKSYFNKSDAANVHRGMQGMRIEGHFDASGEHEKIVCILRENNKKEMLRNEEAYKKMSEHIGRFPAVMIAPDDVELIIGTSDVRRRFLDTLLCQLDHMYMQQLIDYNRILQQRNSLLKSFAEKGYTDHALLDILTSQLVTPGCYVFEIRQRFLSDFLPAVAENYMQIAGSNEPVQLRYYSPLLEGDFKQLMEVYKPKDLMLQRTTIGIHKDDIELQMNGDNFKIAASQGQRKSLLFALKLQEMEQLKAAKGFSPLLLLDDAFEKLDADRMQNLLYHVCVENDGQVFITDTHKERLTAALQPLNVEWQIIDLK